MKNNETFELIKAEVHSILPTAKVLLFGSRADDNATEESDWDILILTAEKPDNNIKEETHKKLFPISVKINAFINTVILSEDDWNHNPVYYTLHQTVTAKKVMA